MTALRDPEVLPDHDLATLLRDAPWKRLAVLGDSVAEGGASRTPATSTSRGSTASRPRCGPRPRASRC